jgi:3-dehydroquinate synthase
MPESLFQAIEGSIDLIIEKSLRIKARVVEEDEKEQGLRRVLNFGHTIGHGIESQCLDGSLYHGECVALGMLPMCSPSVRERLLPIYEKINLPSKCFMDSEAVYKAIAHDKKAEGGMIRIVCCDEIGSFTINKVDITDLKDKVTSVVFDDQNLSGGNSR